MIYNIILWFLLLHIFHQELDYKIIFSVKPQLNYDLHYNIIIDVIM